MYYQYEEPLSQRLAGHRVLALNRGEEEKFLTVKVEAPVNRMCYSYLAKKGDLPRKIRMTARRYCEAVIEDSYDRLIAPGD